MNTQQQTNFKRSNTTPKYANLTSENNSNKEFSTKQWAILGTLTLIMLLGLTYSLFSTQHIRLVSPLKNQSLSAAELSFSWVCDKKDVSFVIEVYDTGNNSELVMRQIVDGKLQYKPEQIQLYNFRANHSYRWLLIANPDIPQKYKFKPESSLFTITQAVEKPVEAINSQNGSASENTQNPSIPPTPLATPIPLKDMKKPPFPLGGTNF